MKYIYIAGPYSNGDTVLNVRLAIQSAERLVARGFVPFIPHLTMFWHLLLPHDIGYWYEYDLAWLDKCDCLLRLPGSSKGADKEVEVAKKKGLPIYYDVLDVGWSNEYDVHRLA